MKLLILSPLVLLLWIPVCFLLVFQPWSHDCFVIDASHGDSWKEFKYIQKKGWETDCGDIYHGDFATPGYWEAFHNHTLYATRTFTTFEEAKAYVENYCKPDTSPVLNR